MKKTILLIMAVFFSQVSFTQNLVPNPSFEDTLNCSQYYGFPEAAYPWFNPTFCTPDYYTTYLNCGFSSLNNPSGYQLPKTGLAYIAIYAWNGPTREYIAVKLDSILQAGVKYKTEFYVSLADNFSNAVDRIGAHFSVDTNGYFGGQCQYLNKVPQVENTPGNILTDTANWILITGSFVAIGGEQFLTIGNFYDENYTSVDTVNPGGLANGAYYYIEDVSVIRCDSCIIQDIHESSLIELQSKVYPNPFKEVTNLYIPVSSDKINSVALLDLSGRNVNMDYNIENRSKHTVIKISGKHITSGIYFINVLVQKEILHKKIIIYN
jgi:hypothetical protein